MLRVLSGGCACGADVVRLLLIGVTGDAAIFNSRKAAVWRGREIWLDVIVVEVERDIPIEVAIASIPWIPFVPAPDLFRRLKIASERGDRIRREHRREYSVTRPRTGMKNPVRIRD